jgi:peptidyl-tRNA hydrolase
VKKKVSEEQKNNLDRLIEDTNPVLYILMRSDLASMNPGKMAAQACHAANKFAIRAKSASEFVQGMYLKWAEQAGKGQHFGTTIVLDCESANKIQFIVDSFEELPNTEAGMVLDTSYPILDGKVIHTLPVFTCGYVFGDKNLIQNTPLREFPLYR